MSVEESIEHDEKAAKCTVPTCRECIQCNVRPCSENGGKHTCPHSRSDKDGKCKDCRIQFYAPCKDCGDDWNDLLSAEGVTTQAQADALKVSGKMRDCRTCNNERDVPAGSPAARSWL